MVFVTMMLAVALGALVVIYFTYFVKPTAASDLWAADEALAEQLASGRQTATPDAKAAAASMLTPLLAESQREPEATAETAIAAADTAATPRAESAEAAGRTEA